MTRFSDQFIAELRQRVRCSDVVSKHVKLSHTGRDEHKGLCPFHKEKSPSFTVSNAKGFFHCFGCGAHGDVIKFMMEMEGLRYPEAIEKLAIQIGMKIPKEPVRASAHSKKIPSLYEVMEMANHFFRQQLGQHREAQEYLVKRGISSNIADIFQLGYAPDDFHALHHYLRDKGISDTLMLDAGLLTRNDKGKIYDRFRHRVIFPILHRNHVVAFGGRILGDGKPKYLNSPETDIFKKGHILYMNPGAQKAAHTHDAVVVTEGYMDTIALHKAGIEHVVAPLGTAITESHLQLLWHMAAEPILCLDGDEAGQRAMAKTIDLALPHLKPGYSLRFALLPKGLDPDDLIRQHGPDSIRQCLEQAIPLSSALWNLEYSAHPVTTPEQWASLEQRLNQRAVVIADKNVQYRYKDFFKSQCWHHSKDIRQRIKQHHDKNSTRSSLNDIMFDISHTPLEVHYEVILLATILAHPHLLDTADIMDEFLHIDASLPYFVPLRDAIMDYIYEQQDANYPITPDALKAHLLQSGLDRPLATLQANHHIVLSQQVERYGDSPDGAVIWDHTIKLYRLVSMEKEFHLLVHQVSQDATEDSLHQMMALQKEITDLKKMLDIH